MEVLGSRVLTQAAVRRYLVSLFSFDSVQSPRQQKT
jgi:hypothetical protein